MTFDVAGEAYDRFMGRYSRPLAADHESGTGEAWRIPRKSASPRATSAALRARSASTAARSVPESASVAT